MQAFCNTHSDFHIEKTVGEANISLSNSKTKIAVVCLISYMMS